MTQEEFQKEMLSFKEDLKRMFNENAEIQKQIINQLEKIKYDI